MNKKKLKEEIRELKEEVRALRKTVEELVKKTEEKQAAGPKPYVWKPV